MTGKQGSIPASPARHGQGTWFSGSPLAQRKGSNASTPRPRREQSASLEAAQTEAYFSDLLSYRWASVHAAHADSMQTKTWGHVHGDRSLFITIFVMGLVTVAMIFISMTTWKQNALVS